MNSPPEKDRGPDRRHSDTGPTTKIDQPPPSRQSPEAYPTDGASNTFNRRRTVEANLLRFSVRLRVHDRQATAVIKRAVPNRQREYDAGSRQWIVYRTAAAAVIDALVEAGFTVINVGDDE